MNGRENKKVMSEFLELQRYGRNKSTLVNKSYINSGEYRKKFDMITDDIEMNRNLYIKAKEMLLHRSGTKYEDMCWFNGNTGKLIAYENTSKQEESIVYTESIQKALRENENIIGMHTHPCSMPPSIADFNSAYNNEYDIGIVLCHDGKVFTYKSFKPIRQSEYEMYIGKFYSIFHNEYDAQVHTLKEFQIEGIISVMELEVHEA